MQMQCRLLEGARVQGRRGEGRVHKWGLPSIKDTDNGAHVLGSANGRQACHPTPNHEHLCRGDPSSCCDLASEESAKLIGSLHNSSATIKDSR